jgi:hypothetical protein
LDGFLKWIKDQNKIAYYASLILPLIWIVEIKNYIYPRYKNIHHENVMSEKNKSDFRRKVTAQITDLKQYQATICVPKTQFWSDKFLSDMHWSTHFNAVMLSMVFDIPMANALLSRPSTQQYIEGIQLLAHPLILKENFHRFDNKKKFLIILGKDHPSLSIGEQHLINSSKLVFDDPSFKMYEISPESLRKSSWIKSAIEKYQSGLRASPLFSMNYDETQRGDRFFGAGSKSIVEGVNYLGEYFYDGKSHTTMTLSAWIRVDNRKYGLGDWKIQVGNKTSSRYEHKFNARHSRDIQHGYVRIETDFDIRPGESVKIFVSANQNHIIDELVIHYKDNEYLIDDTASAYFLYNGYKILKP